MYQALNVDNCGRLQRQGWNDNQGMERLLEHHGFGDLNSNK